MWCAYTKTIVILSELCQDIKKIDTCHLSTDTTNSHLLNTRLPFDVIFGKPTATLTHLTVIACLKTIEPLYNNNNQPKQQQVCMVVLK
jgi:hypothetical protein